MQKLSNKSIYTANSLGKELIECGFKSKFYTISQVLNEVLGVLF